MGVLVTGAAGFIGSCTSLRLLDRGEVVIGIDNLNDYYDPAIKTARVRRLQASKGGSSLIFVEQDLADRDGMTRLFTNHDIDRVVHLGAQAGVRHSLQHPHIYANSNILGTLNVLEGCRDHGIDHLVYASTSSVFGSDTALPFSPHAGAAHPLTFYAASKRANELMAHAYSNLFGLSCTGLRFFTVYGPWGRPDMALFKFTKAILEGSPIDIYNNGMHERDFTYIDDIVEGVIRTLDQPAAPDPSFDPSKPDPCLSSSPWRVYNIGSGAPVNLLRFVEVIEACLGKKARCNLLPMQPGDVVATCADTTDLERDFGWKPRTTIEEGVSRFVDWYLEYFGLEHAAGRANAPATN